MAEGDKQQHEIDAKKADNNSYSGQSADAQKKRYEGNTSGNSKYASDISSDLRKDAKDEKQARTHKHNKYLLYLQLQDVAEGIKNIGEKMHAYGTTIKQAEDVEIRLGNAAASSQSIQDVLSQYEGREGRNRLLRESYGELSAIEGHENNLWGQLKNNIIHDSQGNMVYMDETGHLYRLKTDEHGNVETRTDPETGEQIPIREAITNEAEQLELYEKAYVSQPPGLFANETPFGEDTTNSIYHQQNQWGIDYKGTNAPKPENTIASHETTEEEFIGCGYIAGLGEVCTAAKHDLGLEIKEHQSKLEDFNKRLDDLKAQQTELESKNASAKALDELQDKIDELEGDIEKETKSLQEKINEYNDPKSSVNQPENYNTADSPFQYQPLDTPSNNIQNETTATPSWGGFNIIPTPQPTQKPEAEDTCNDGCSSGIEVGKNSFENVPALKNTFNPAVEGITPKPEGPQPKPENQPQSYTNSFNSFANPELQGTTTYGPTLSPEAIENGGYTLEQEDGTQIWVNTDGSTMSMEDKIKEYEAEHGPLKEGAEISSQNSVVFQNNF